MATPPPNDQPANPPIMISTPQYSGPERRSAERLWRESVDRRFAAGAEKMDSLSKGLADNTAATEAIRTNTQALVDMFHSLSGALKVLHWIGNLAKPVGAIVLAASAFVGLWSSLKGGTPPSIK